MVLLKKKRRKIIENIITPMEGVLTIVDQFGQEVQYQLLFQIESQEEWAVVQQAIEEFSKEMEEGAK